MAARVKTARVKRKSKPAATSDWRTPRLKGKTFCFTGTLSHDRNTLAKLVRGQRGRLEQTITAGLDYLVVGQTRGSGPSVAEKKAQALNQKGAAIQVIDESAFHQLLVPDRDTAVAMLRAGKEGIDRWNALVGRFAFQVRVDLSGVDFRKCNLSHANLSQADVDGCDFREANLDGVVIERVSVATFDGGGGGIAISQARSCSFQRFQFGDPERWPLFGKLSGCDLSGSRWTGGWSHMEIDTCRFDRADCREADFAGSHFSACSFRGANLAGASFAGCDLTGADLSRANLSGANLESARLTRANLSKADLRNAKLIDADLTDAVIDGANFTGAQVAGVDLSTLDASKCKGLREAAAAVPAITIGPSVLDLEQVAAKSQRIETGIELESSSGTCRVSVQSHSGGRWVSTQCSDARANRWGHQSSVSSAMSDLARRCAGGQLRFNTLIAKASKAPLKGKPLKDLCLAAWCEIFGQELPTAEALAEQARADKAGQQDLRETLLADLKSGAKGVSRWNDRPALERKQASPFRNLDLAGLNLQGVNFEALDFQGTSFQGANLKKANCGNADLKRATLDKADASGASFGGAKLNDASCREGVFRKSNLQNTTLLRTCFQAADLSGASLRYATLAGADFTGANLSGTKFDATRFDETTIFPDGFTLPDGLVWAGKGKDPRVVQKVTELQQSGPVDFDAFMQRLEESFDASRLKKAVSMLKADSFQLFAQVEPDSVTGVVKSQTDPDLVYSCRLDSGGAFACCTQNLNPCGGLRGALCKHLLVLIVGLTRAGDLDPTTVNGWVLASRLQAPQLDKDRMSEVFLRYKGAEAGEIDWRPTETLPEDYYAF